MAINIRGDADSTFLALLRHLIGRGGSSMIPVLRAGPRGMGTTEMLNIQLEYDFAKYSPFCRRYAEPNVLRYFARELAWYMSEDPTLAGIVEGSSFQKKASNDGEFLNSSYGARLAGVHPQRQLFDGCYTGGPGFHQLRYCANLLAHDLDTRRACAVILERDDLTEDDQLGFKSKDVPCTIAIQWIARERRLHQIVTMRSNDVWRGFVYDVPCFAFIHATVLHLVNGHLGRANRDSLGLGKYWHNVHSMHLYDRWRPDAEACVDGAWPVAFESKFDFARPFPFEDLRFQYGMGLFLEDTCYNHLEGEHKAGPIDNQWDELIGAWYQPKEKWNHADA